MTNTQTEQPDQPRPGETFKEMMIRLGATEDTSSGSTVTFLSAKGVQAAKKQTGLDTTGG